MVPLLVVLLQEKQFILSLVVFVIAGITDAVDGWVAKRFDAVTKLGAILDPLADKALLVSAYVMLSIMQVIPFWLMVVVVFRDLVIITGYAIMVLFFGSVTMNPLSISKINTFVQIAFIFFALVALAFAIDLEQLIFITSYIVLITSVVSGVAYVYIWSIKATKLSEQASSG